MLLALALLVFALILGMELPGLLKIRLYKEARVFVILFLLGVYLVLAQLYQWPMPNPLSDLYSILDARANNA